MTRRAFTMVELLLAVMLVGVITVLSVLTFRAVTKSWLVSTEYMDKMQRTDFALNQVISGLRSMYYPHDGKQDDAYGFVLEDNGSGEDPDDSDIIEWSKTGPAIVGNKNALADTVHRVRVMILEQGNSDWLEPIEVTGLYARLCPDVALQPRDDKDETDFSFANDEIYQPVLIADGIVGFDCKVMKEKPDEVKAENDESLFEDVYDASNAAPYKVQLTFRIADPEGKSYRSNTAPLMRIIKIPIHEQSLDGATPPSEGKKDAKGTRGGTGRTGGSGTRGGSGPNVGPGTGGQAPISRPGATGGAGRPGGQGPTVRPGFQPGGGVRR